MHCQHITHSFYRKYATFALFRCARAFPFRRNHGVLIPSRSRLQMHANFPIGHLRGAMPDGLATRRPQENERFGAGIRRCKIYDLCAKWIAMTSAHAADWADNPRLSGFQRVLLSSSQTCRPSSLCVAAELGTKSARQQPSLTDSRCCDPQLRQAADAACTSLTKQNLCTRAFILCRFICHPRSAS